MNGAFNCTGGTGNFNSGLKDNGDVLTLIVTYEMDSYVQAVNVKLSRLFKLNR